jgi:hypothetical protein
MAMIGTETLMWLGGILAAAAWLAFCFRQLWTLHRMKAQDQAERRSYLELERTERAQAQQAQGGGGHAGAKDSRLPAR